MPVVKKSKSGLYIGNSHAQGGIPEVVPETGQKIEVEGMEYRLCPAILENPELLEFKNKTNFEILEALHEKSCVFEQGKIPAGSFIICKLAVLDKTKRNMTGTVREIINLMQDDKGCKVENHGTTMMASGGEIMEPEIKARWDKKREHIETLANNIRRLRHNITLDLKSENEKTFLTALVVAVMMRTGERIGNTDSEKNNRYGCCGFRKRHISVDKNNLISLKYVGKSSVVHELNITDGKLAPLLKQAIKNSPTSFIFTTSNGFRIKAPRCNNYLKEFGVTNKDIRGYSSNQWIIERLKNNEIPKEEKDRKKLFIKIIKDVAHRVGHGAATLRKHYTLPELESEYVQHGKIIELKEVFSEGGEVGEKKEKGYGVLMLGLECPCYKKHVEIAPEDIYEEPGFGIEKEPHITLLYGLHDDEVNPEEVIAEAQKHLKGDIKVKMTGISLFENDVPYDVVKFDVEPGVLAEVNKAIKDKFPNTSTFPDYHPHVTIGYVKKGKGKKYIKELSEPIISTGTEIIYSHPDDSYGGTGNDKVVVKLEKEEKILKNGGDIKKSSNFESVNITRDDIIKVFTGEREVTSGANIQAALAYYRREKSANRQVSFSKEWEDRTIERFATESKLIAPTPTSLIGKGNEQFVYPSEDKDYILKINTLARYSTWEEYFQNLLIHNLLFKKTAYELVGFVKWHNGKLMPLVKQLFITAAQEATQPKISQYFNQIGFESKPEYAYYSPDLTLIIADLHTGNVLCKNDVLYFIDTVCYFRQYVENIYMEDGGALESGGNVVSHTPQDKIKVLYLHGYKDTTTRPLVDVIFKNYHGYAPRIDYDDPAWDKLEGIVEEYKPTLIIGHSLGGYFAYYLSQKFNIPAILLCPAFENGWDKKQPIPEAIVNLPNRTDNKIAVVGMKDKDLPVKKVLSFLKIKAQIFEEEIGHQIPGDVFEEYLTDLRYYWSFEEDGSINSKKSSIFVKKITKDETRYVLSGKSQDSNGITIQAASSYLGGDAGSSYEAKEDRGGKREEEEKLRRYADAHGLWFDKSILGENFSQGAEQRVYALGYKYVIKLNDSYFYNSWIDYFHSLLLHNLFFPDTVYELLGFTVNSDSLFCAVVKQPFIQDNSDTDLRVVKEFMEDNGFKKREGKENDYYNPELGILIEDLHENNVLTKNTVLYFVDTVFFVMPYLEFKEGGVIKKEATTNDDLNSKRLTSLPELSPGSEVVIQTKRDSELHNSESKDNKNSHKHPPGKYVSVNGANLWVETLGKGDPLFIIAGGAGNNHAYLHSLDDLKDSCTLVFIDNFGRGKSDVAKDIKEYSISRDVEDIEGIRKALGYDKISVLGHSYGSIVAQLYALKYGAHTKSLIIIAGFYSGKMWQANNDNVNREIARHNPEEYHELMLMRNRGLISSDKEFDDKYSSIPKSYLYTPGEVNNDYDKNYPDGNSADVYYQITGADANFVVGNDIAKFNITKELKNLKMPVLILSGIHDGVSLPEWVIRYEEYCPQAQLVMFENSGHQPHVDEKEKALSVIRDFVKNKFDMGGEVQKEVAIHQGTFEKIQQGEINTPEQLGEALTIDHKADELKNKSNMEHIQEDEIKEAGVLESPAQVLGQAIRLEKEAKELLPLNPEFYSVLRRVAARLKLCHAYAQGEAAGEITRNNNLDNIDETDVEAAKEYARKWKEHAKQWNEPVKRLIEQTQTEMKTEELPVVNKTTPTEHAERIADIETIMQKDFGIHKSRIEFKEIKDGKAYFSVMVHRDLSPEEATALNESITEITFKKLGMAPSQIEEREYSIHDLSYDSENKELYMLVRYDSEDFFERGGIVSKQGLEKLNQQYIAKIKEIDKTVELGKNLDTLKDEMIQYWDKVVKKDSNYITDYLKIQEGWNWRKFIGLGIIYEESEREENYLGNLVFHKNLWRLIPDYYKKYREAKRVHITGSHDEVLEKFLNDMGIEHIQGRLYSDRFSVNEHGIISTDGWKLIFIHKPNAELKDVHKEYCLSQECGSFGSEAKNQSMHLRDFKNIVPDANQMKKFTIHSDSLMKFCHTVQKLKYVEMTSDLMDIPNIAIDFNGELRSFNSKQLFRSLRALKQLGHNEVSIYVPNGNMPVLITPKDKGEDASALKTDFVMLMPIVEPTEHYNRKNMMYFDAVDECVCQNDVKDKVCLNPNQEKINELEEKLEASKQKPAVLKETVSKEEGDAIKKKIHTHVSDETVLDKELKAAEAETLRIQAEEAERQKQEGLERVRNKVKKLTEVLS